MKHLNPRQETFCLKYTELGEVTAAMIAAGYSPKWSKYNSTRQLNKPLIQARIKELRQRTEDETVMGVLERKRRLSEIARAKLTDFMELGADGSWVNLGPETKNSAAIQEIHSRTEYDDNGAKATIHTNVKLYDQIRAIS